MERIKKDLQGKCTLTKVRLALAITLGFSQKFRFSLFGVHYRMPVECMSGQHGIASNRRIFADVIVYIFAH